MYAAEYVVAHIAKYGADEIHPQIRATLVDEIERSLSRPTPAPARDRAQHVLLELRQVGACPRDGFRHARA